MCGKILVEYPLSYGQPKYEFLQYFLDGAYSDAVDMGPMQMMSVASIVIVWF